MRGAGLPAVISVGRATLSLAIVRPFDVTAGSEENGHSGLHSETGASVTVWGVGVGVGQGE